MKDFWGFGYYRDKDGILVRKENNHGVITGPGVEIGRFSCVDKGSYRDTIIEEGTKIDNLVHIGHNVLIGKHCLIVAGTVVGGSCTIGDYSYLGMNVSVKDHVNIGKHCIIGAGSVVIRDVPDKTVVVGNPAKPIKYNMDGKDLYNMVGLYHLD